MLIGDYFFPADGTKAADHELYFIDLLSAISAEDPFGEFEWLIQPTTGVRQSMRHDKPWQRFYEFTFDGLQSNRDFARSEDGFLQSLFSKGPLAALLHALGLDALADGITAIFGIVNEFNGLVEDVTSIVQSVNDYLRGITEFIKESFAWVCSVLTRVSGLIAAIEDGIAIAKNLPHLFSEQWNLLQQTWQGFVTLSEAVINQKGLETGIYTCAEARKVRDFLLALAANPQAFQAPLPIPTAQTIAVQIEPNSTIENIAARLGVDPASLIAVNNLRFPFIDARLRPETQRQAALDRVGTSAYPGPLTRQLNELTSDALRVQAAVAAATANEPPLGTAAHATWQLHMDRTVREHRAYQARVASVYQQIHEARTEAQAWTDFVDAGSPLNPRFNEHVTQPGVLYAGDHVRVPMPRPDLVPSVVGVDGNMILNTGVAATEEERLFGIDLLLDDDKNLEWDLDRRDLKLVRGLENIHRTQVKYVRLPLGALRFAPGIGNYAWRDLARWQNEGTNRLLAYALYRTISQDPRVTTVREVRAITYAGVAHLVYHATLINGMSVSDMRTPLYVGAGVPNA